MTKDLEMKKPSWIIGVGGRDREPKYNHMCPSKGGRRFDPHRREGNGITEAEIGMMWPQAKAGRQPPETGREKERFSPRALRESVALLTPCFHTLASSTVREIIFVPLNYQVYCNLEQQSQETNSGITYTQLYT